ncbi:MAG TPA: PHP domain-containing protein [Egibacteraceae bacterium]|nr:PHP domain-containing protein [Egibacteraceae bacterium]
MTIDFHTHTRFSDGSTTPTQNAELAAIQGVRGLAITDHDTMAGWDEAAEACAAKGLIFVPGIELSAEQDARSVHLLGYWVDPAHPGLRAECERLRGERSRRALEILDRLALLGIEISLRDVLVHAGDAPIGRPHIAAAMVAAGAVVDIEAAFDDYLADSGPAYVPKHALSPERAVELLIAAGGAAVLAHPGLPPDGAPISEALLDRLAGAGLSGIEADHASHDAPTSARWRRIAADRDLLVTGSSDFHGEGKAVKIGERTASIKILEALRARAGRRSQPW